MYSTKPHITFSVISILSSKTLLKCLETTVSEPLEREILVTTPSDRVSLITGGVTFTAILLLVVEATVMESSEYSAK